MTAHNCGKINWYIFYENIKYNKMKFSYDVKNIKSIKYISNQIFSQIESFSNSEQKKKSKKKILNKYSDHVLDLTNIYEFHNVKSKNKEYYLYYALVSGNSQAVQGLITLLLEVYIFLNLYIGGFFDDRNFYSIVTSQIMGCILWNFVSNDNDLPLFLEQEFYEIMTYVTNAEILKSTNWINEFAKIDKEKTNFTLEQIDKTKQFCSLIFKCLYLTHKNYKQNYNLEDVIMESICTIFRINKYECI